MDLLCYFCEHGWDYQGGARELVTCPSCGRKVNISKSRKKEQVI